MAISSHDPELAGGAPVGEWKLAWTLVVVACALGAWLTPYVIPFPEWAGPRPWWSGGRTRASLAAAATLLIPGVLLALAAIRALGRPTALVSLGPYRWVRHPYYLAILLLLAGTIVAMRSLPAVALLVPAVRLTVGRARREEHNLALRLGDEWRDYAIRVPFLLPLAPPLPRGGMPALRASERRAVLEDLPRE